MGSKQASRRAVVVIAAVTKSPKMLAATAVAVMLALALGAAPGLAHGKDRHMPAYVYAATIDCGRGPVTVVSEEDLWAPLVDLDRHRQYLPIAWDVEVDGQPVFQEESSMCGRTQAPGEGLQLHRRRRHRHRHGARPIPPRDAEALRHPTTRSPGTSLLLAQSGTHERRRDGGVAPAKAPQRRAATSPARLSSSVTVPGRPPQTLARVRSTSPKGR